MDLKRVFTKVFAWMFIGLLITFLTGYTVANNYKMLEFVFSGFTWIIFAIVEFVLVVVLSARIQKMNPMTAKICFIVYSLVTGLTFSSIFVVYKLTSIIYVFGITSGLFGAFALIGKFTNIDLTKFGTYLFMGLIAVIVCSIINMFVGSESFNFVIILLSILIFLGYTAYDIQKIKKLANFFENEDNLAICGALELYLDFINLFIDLLKLFGKERN